MAIEDVVKGNNVYCTYFSLEEFLQAAERRISKGEGRRAVTCQPDEWRGGTVEECFNLARMGWDEHLTATLAIAESAVELAEKDHDVEVFVPVWDVTGSEVDVARYLQGTPENMIDFPMITTSKVGKVITLCAGGFYSAAVNEESLVKRGQVLTALALALSRLGHACELWVDIELEGMGRYKKTGNIKVLVKGANDEIDPARILFAYAHPGMFRALGFSVMNGFPPEFEKVLGAKGSYSGVGTVKRDLPEGTIYLPGLSSYYDVPDADVQLRKMLGELGLLAE